MAHRIAGKQRSHRPHKGPQGDLCNLRHPLHAHYRWRTRIHRLCNKRSADQLGGPPPDFLGIQPSREQPRRNRGQNRQEAGNTDPGGALKSAFFKALLTYRNCPCPDTRMSPAMCLFGRPIRDLLPTLPTRLQQPTQDGTTQHTRQTALKKRQSLGKKRWTEHTKGLSPLKRGDRVLVQNQTGHHPTKWDSTGVVVEVMQYHQYQVRMDSNGRATANTSGGTPSPSLHQTTPYSGACPIPSHQCCPDQQHNQRHHLANHYQAHRYSHLATPYQAPPPSQPSPGNPVPPPSQPSPGNQAPPPSQPSLGTPATPTSLQLPGTPEPPQPPRAHTTTQRQPTITPATTRSYAAVAGTPVTRRNPPPLAPKKLAQIPPPPPKPTNPAQNALRRSTRTRKPRQF